MQSAGAIGAVEIAKAIMPYPTYAEAVKYCCNQYNIGTWGGWEGLKATWAPRLARALLPGSSDVTPAATAGVSRAPTASSAGAEPDPGAAAGEPGCWGAIGGFVAGGVCVAALGLLRRSARL